MMYEYKVSRYEEEFSRDLRPSLARVLGISPRTLARYDYEVLDGQLVFHGKAPRGFTPGTPINLSRPH